MCGRYYIDESTVIQIQGIVMEAERKLNLSVKRDILPSDKAPVIVRRGTDEMASELFPWGFPGFGSGKLIINARAESALERPMFCESVKTRRCVIPAAGFYEWNAKKEKYVITKEKGSVLYLAGLYNLYDNEKRFVILTTAANDSMKYVHERMPLVLEENEVREWLLKDQMASDLLEKIPGRLHAETEYEQQTLKFD